MKNYHGEIVRPPVKDSLLYDKCGFIAYRLDQFHNHIACSHEERQFQCIWAGCGKWFGRDIHQ